MMLIPLTRGLFAKVDDADFEWLSVFKWYAQPTKSKLQLSGGIQQQRFYAARRVSKTRLALMHREIAKTAKGKKTDHRNGRTLDNRRSNLRHATDGQNASNQQIQRNKKLSRFKGVAFVRCLNKSNPWMAFINQAGKRFYLGYFPTEESAALAYNAAASEKFGEFACLNPV